MFKKPNSFIKSLFVYILPVLLFSFFISRSLNKETLIKNKAAEKSDYQTKKKSSVNGDGQLTYKYFKGYDVGTGQWTSDVAGIPKEVSLKDGKIMVDFFGERRYQVNPLAIVESKYDQHPAETILNLSQRYPLLIDPDLRSKLRDPNQRDSFFIPLTSKVNLP